ncbi:MAG: CotH kinase family protein [Oscillospiraceae bacterium]|nr:CotH kinase family protein [Oscillospiraceae bacterium]
MIITSKRTLDLTQMSGITVVDAVQSDQYSRNLELSLVAGDAPWVVPEGAAVQIRYSKADGKGGEYDTLPNGDIAWMIQENVLTVALAPQVLTVAGPVNLSVMLILGEKILNTFGMIINVHPRVDAGIADSEGYYRVTGFLPAPVSAKKGQYIRVAAVDEYNKVTEVETVDLAAGSGEGAAQTATFSVKDAQIAVCTPREGCALQVTTKLPYLSGGAGYTAVSLHHCGKNLLKRTRNNFPLTTGGVTAELTADGGLHMTGTSTGAQIYWAYNDLGLVLLPGSYKLSNAKTSGVSVNMLPGWKTNNVTITETTTFASVYVQIPTGTVIDEVYYPQLEIGTEETAFEPYCGNTYSAEFGRTVYGGEYDWSSGKLIITHDAQGELAAPEVVQLTAQENLTAFSGINNLYSSVGTTSVSGETETEGNEDLEDRVAQLEQPDMAAYGLPVLYLNGDISAMNKDNAATLSYRYGDRTGTCSVKWQGSSSLAYPKKNYTVKFDTAFEAKTGWGSQKKYCLKANYIDFSHARNLVCAKLWGQVVKSRTTANERLNALVNGGAVDGFPITVYINGEYAGLYTFNIPKDGWMYGMGEGTNECIICADVNGAATQFKGTALLDGTDFEMEYITDESNTQWAVDSVNQLISACINSDGTDLDTTIAQYLDIDSAIDYWLFVAFIGGDDMIVKNYLLSTYDGTKWFYGAYDMDAVFGLHWAGTSIQTANGYATLSYIRSLNTVMDLLATHKPDALKQRYRVLKSSVLSEENVVTVFANFIGSIPKAIYDRECVVWKSIPSTSVNQYGQICDWYRRRLQWMDKWMEQL